MRSAMLLPVSSCILASAIVSAAIPDPVRIDSGLISSTTSPASGVRVFKGIPYAAPPAGDLRWRPPRSAARDEVGAGPGIDAKVLSFFDGFYAPTSQTLKLICVPGRQCADPVFFENG